MTAAALKTVLAENYGIEGSLIRLDGDVDENWRVSNGSQSFFVKVARGSGGDSLRLTASILDGLHQCNVGLPVETVFPSFEGDRVCETRLGQDCVSVRVTNFLPGEVLSSKTQLEWAELRSLGSTLGLLDKALETLELKQPSAHQWELSALSDDHQVQSLPLSPDLRTHLTNYLSEGWPLTKAKLATLPHQIIHNDFDGDNILLGVNAVSGVLDFGDISYGPKVVDLAVTAAYLDSRWHNIDVTSSCIDAYRLTSGISDLEMALLGDVVRARNALRILNAAAGAKENPENSSYRLRNIEFASIAFLEHDRKLWEGIIA